MEKTSFIHKLLGIALPLVLFLSLFGIIFYILVYQNEDIVRLASVQVAVIAVTAVWLAGKFWKAENRFVRSRLNLPVLVFLGACLVSIIWAKNPYQGLAEFFRLAVYAALYFLLANNVKSDKLINRFTYSVLALSAIIAVHGILQYIGLDFLWFMFPAGAATSRVSSVFGNPDFLGGYMAMVFPVAFSLFLFRKNKLFFALACVLIFLSMLLTFTRSAWVSWGMSFIFFTAVLAVLRRDIFKKSLKWFLGAMAAFAMLAVILNIIRDGAVFSRISAIFNWSENNVQVRFRLWDSAIKVFMRRPLTGVGLDNFRIVEYGCRVHNEYLQMLAETGILGLGAFAWLIFSYFREGFGVLRKSSSYRQVLAIAFMSSVFAMLADSLFCFPLHRVSHNVLFWGIMGVTVALGRTEEEQKTEIPSGKKSAWRFPVSAGIFAAAAFFIFIILRSFAGVYHYQKGFDVNRYAGQSAEARLRTIQEFEKAARLAPYHYQIQHDWAIVAIQSGSLDKGEKAMERSEKLYPDRMPDVRLELGLLYYQRGDYKKAEEVWKEAAEKFPSSEQAHYYLGVLCNNQNRLKEAEKYCSRAIELNPSNPDYFRLLVKIYFRTGNRAGAKEAVQKGLLLVPDDPEFQIMKKALKR